MAIRATGHQDRGKNKSMPSTTLESQLLIQALQGFDEFMNLVIDDAVEVKQATKTDPSEKRRELGI